MSVGCWVSRSKVRRYVEHYPKLAAKSFKPLLAEAGNQFSINAEFKAPKRFTLELHPDYALLLKFELDGSDCFPVPLVWDTPRYPRLIFICPCCLRRKLYLYGVTNGWACATCLNLHYSVQSEAVLDRGRNRIRKLRRGIWGSDACENLFEMSSQRQFDKPKGMHWQTFCRKLELLNELEQRYWGQCSAWLDARFGGLSHAD